MLTLEKNYTSRRVQTMNSIVYDPSETELDIRCITAETATPEDIYSTTPLAVVRPPYWQPDEEELHSSFEEAISDRVLAVNRQLRRLSVPLTDNLSVQSPTSTVVKRQRPSNHCPESPDHRCPAGSCFPFLSDTTSQRITPQEATPAAWSRMIAPPRARISRTRGSLMR
jgi:hypothetical protein